VTAFVIAGAGVRVAKHGNRSISSRCGSADVMEGLGVNIGLNAAQMAAAIRDVGIAFLFAPSLNPAMRHAMPARVELKMRTVFNLLGPLTNPAGAGVQVVGAPSEAAASLMAEALAELGLRSGWVVHALDGMDEITTTGETLALRVRDGRVETRVLTPEEFGVPRASISDLAGGDLAANTEIAREVLGGRRGPKRDAVLVNAAAALLAAERVRTLPEGVEMAARSIDSGAAASKLDALREFSVAAKSAP
jgi:anthranilate phosphoribosyltransferase